MEPTDKNKINKYHSQLRRKSIHTVQFLKKGKYLGEIRIKISIKSITCKGKKWEPRADCLIKAHKVKTTPNFRAISRHTYKHSHKQS